MHQIQVESLERNEHMERPAIKPRKSVKTIEIRKMNPKEADAAKHGHRESLLMTEDNSPRVGRMCPQGCYSRQPAGTRLSAKR